MYFSSNSNKQILQRRLNLKLKLNKQLQNRKKNKTKKKIKKKRRLTSRATPAQQQPTLATSTMAQVAAQPSQLTSSAEK
jgi:uncharacterized protein YdaU (DUF1376 family)